MIPGYDPVSFTGTYRRWAAGLCPCCGARLTEWTDGTPPAAIGEGVMVCGRCVAMDHLSPDGFRDMLLDAIARRQ